MNYSETITFQSGNETLVGTIDWNENKDKPRILSLHGGGPSARVRITYIAEELAKNGHSVIRFDHSGHGESSGNLDHSSLNKRKEEALCATQFMALDQPITVIATSMGGHVALELLQHLNIKSLILFCPAAYAAEAHDIRFDSGFTDILREPNSFQRATVFSNLEKFTGNFLHVIGEQDTIIPPGVTELYQSHSVNAAKREFIVMPTWPHNMHNLFSENQKEKQELIDKILNLI